jgi:hypothetical protein
MEKKSISTGDPFYVLLPSPSLSFPSGQNSPRATRFADMKFSFAILIWEMMTEEIPYEGQAPLK